MSIISRAVSGIGYWVPFASRTAAYGLVSTTTGLFTGGRSSRWAMRAWCQSSLQQLRIDVTSRHLERLHDGPCVLIANHQSVLDILVLGSLFEQDYRWVAKRSLFAVPFLGWHLALQGHIPVDRHRAGNQERLDVACRRAFEVGAQVLIFPEGTRSVDGVLQPFRKGAFVIAAENKVPIVPISLSGTAGLMHKGDWTLTDDPTLTHPVTVEVLPAISPVGDAEHLRDKAYRAIADSLRAAGAAAVAA